MFYLGIDIGKRNHVASLIDEKSKVIFKAFSFTNTIDGANSLIEKVLLHTDIQNVEIGMEATGHYWLSIYSFLIEQGFIVHVVNPIQTDGWRKGTEIRKRKTDIIDSILIADLIRKVICVLDQVFPEYQSIFSDIFGQTSKELLTHLQSADDFENITSKQLNKILENISLKNFAKNKITQISQLAANSFGLKFCRDSFSLQLKLLIEQIRFIEAQVSDVETEIKAILQKINSPITTIPGISDINAAIILGEIGDISRFSNASKLVAYAGIDASVNQSGAYNSNNNRMSKRGSPYLRKALFQAALVASFNDPVFSNFYKKKRSQGKHHLTVIGAVARKLCNTIFAVLKYNVPYVIKLE